MRYLKIVVLCNKYTEHVYRSDNIEFRDRVYWAARDCTMQLGAALVAMHN